MDTWIGNAERALKDILARVSFSSPPPTVAIAYSGGLDSSVLLHILHQFAQRHPLKLFAFHVHHGLNPKADEWLAHCEQEARSYGLSFAARKVKVDREAGTGLEESARRARYAALGELCREHGVPLLLTAHHEDDQAETVLLQLMRGAGLPGLAGMPRFIEHHELLAEPIALGRPLLDVSRAALAAAATQLAIRHIDDDSNNDIRYRRNALRHKLTPLLDEFFPSHARCISRSSQHVQQALRLLSELAELDLARCRHPDSDERLDLNELRQLSADRADNVLRYWLIKQAPPAPSDAQLQQIRSQMLEGAPDSEPFYECGPLILQRIGSWLVRESATHLRPTESIMVKWQGQASIAIPEWRGRLVFYESESGGISARRLREQPLVLQARSGRERLKLAPNRPSKSLKNLYQEAGIYPAERRWLPLVSLQDQVIFAAGLGMDCRAFDAAPGICLQWENL